MIKDNYDEVRGKLVPAPKGFPDALYLSTGERPDCWNSYTAWPDSKSFYGDGVRYVKEGYRTARPVERFFVPFMTLAWGAGYLTGIFFGR